MIAAEIVDAVNSGNAPAALLKNEVGEMGFDQTAAFFLLRKFLNAPRPASQPASQSASQPASHCSVG